MNLCCKTFNFGSCRTLLIILVFQVYGSEGNQHKEVVDSLNEQSVQVQHTHDELVILLGDQVLYICSNVYGL